MTRRHTCTAVSALAAAALVALSLVSAPAAADRGLSLRYLRTSELQPGTTVGGIPVGGLSGLTYDSATRTLIAVSDDKGDYGPPRLYFAPVESELTGGTITPTLQQVPLRDANGTVFAKNTADLEAVRKFPNANQLLITSEGNAADHVAPFVRSYTYTGNVIRNYRIPTAYLPNATGTRGVRPNLAFEGAAIVNGTINLVTESALAQDGPTATVTAGSSNRWLRILPGGRTEEYVYRTDPLPAGSAPGTDTGVSEILALNADQFLVLERGFDPGTNRNHAKIYLATVRGATPVTGRATLTGKEHPIAKRLLFDFAKIGSNPDNVEGMTLGPRLRDGKQALLVGSDNNFNTSQRTLFHLLELR